MNQTVLRIVSLGVMVLCVLSLALWYTALSRQKATITTRDTARGYKAEEPVPPISLLGSTFENISAEVGASRASSSVKTRSSRIYRVSQAPVAGMGFKKTNEGVRLLFVERATGHIFSENPETGSIERISNMLIPRMYEALWNTNGLVALRGLDENLAITTFVASPERSTSSASVLTGQFLPPNIDSFVWSPSGNDFAYSLLTDAGTAIYRGAPDKKPSLIASSGVRDWGLLWSDRILALQRPAANTNGALYSLGAGVWEKLLEAPALSITAETDGLVIASSVVGGSPSATISSSSAVSRRATLPTVADKCAWGSLPKTTGREERIAYCAVPEYVSREFPDSWYRGSEHTTDTWWSIDAVTGDSKKMLTDSELPSFDVMRPLVSSDGRYLAFMNARDLSLWVVKLSD
ncbi:hypothetical protein EBR66_01935 [bacterium]|nr:hypothetical protein [bacterium]